MYMYLCNVCLCFMSDQDNNISVVYLQLRDVLLSHNIMTERCFSTCITKFRQNKLTDEEVSQGFR